MLTPGCGALVVEYVTLVRFRANDGDQGRGFEISPPSGLYCATIASATMALEFNPDLGD